MTGCKAYSKRIPDADAKEIAAGQWMLCHQYGRSLMFATFSHCLKIPGNWRRHRYPALARQLERRAGFPICSLLHRKGRHKASIVLAYHRDNNCLRDIKARLTA